MYLQASGLVAARDLVVGGTTIPAGTEMTSEQIAGLKTLQPLLANGWIAVSPDLYARKTREANPEPTYLSPGAYRALIAALQAEEAAPASAPELDPEPPVEG